MYKKQLKSFRELIKGSQNYLICKAETNAKSFVNFVNEYEISSLKDSLSDFTKCKNAYNIMRLEFTDNEIIELYKALEC